MGYAAGARLAKGVNAGSLLITRIAALESAASMQETTEQPTLAPEAANGLTETAARAQDWAGEPFLRADEDPAVVLAPGTARRLALDDAVEEMDAGRTTPSYEWKRRYALMLGLERVLTNRPPRLPSGTELRKHQIAAAGFVEAARTLGVLILTHRRLLVSQFNRDLTAEGYGDRIVDAIERGQEPPEANPLTIQTYAWFARHWGDLNPEAYHLVIADEAHTALGEKTSAAIRGFTNPIYIGMTATEQLIAKQVSDVFPASVDDLPLADAARRGLIAPLRSLRVPPAAAIHTVPIVGGDFEERALAQALDHQALNQAAASLYRDRFDSTPGIVYAAGVEHAYNLAKEFRAAGLKAEAVSGRPPPGELSLNVTVLQRD